MTGTGGDFITQCCNNPADIKFTEYYTVKYRSFSTKPKEHLLKCHTNQLIDYINSFDTQYISTHLYRSAVSLPYPKISLIVSDESMYETFIFRDLKTRNVRLSNSDKNLSVFSLIKFYKNKNKINKAAQLFYEFSSKSWIKKMSFRKNNSLPDSKVIDISKIFNDKGFDDLISQLPVRSELFDCARQMHSRWSSNQCKNTKDSVIEELARKIAIMDLNSSESMIYYSKED
jgi:hypothetical protein